MSNPDLFINSGCIDYPVIDSDANAKAFFGLDHIPASLAGAGR
jgi:hypothetical protein